MTQGFATIPRWLLYSDRFTAHAKLVYLVIQSHTDEYGTSYPGIRRIGDESGLSRSSVKRALEALNDAGLVTVTARSRANGGRSTNSYRISSVLSPGT